MYGHDIDQLLCSGDRREDSSSPWSKEAGKMCETVMFHDELTSPTIVGSVCVKMNIYTFREDGILARSESALHHLRSDDKNMVSKGIPWS